MSWPAIATPLFAALTFLAPAATAPAQGHGAGPEELSRRILSAWAQAPLDPAGAQGDLAAIIRENPSSPLTEEASRLYLQCRKYAADPGAGAEIDALLEKESELHGFAARRLRRAAADAAAARGDLDGWERLLRRSPAPQHYLVLGPLGDFADDQHGVPFPPERLGIDLERPEKGSYGMVRWRRLARPWNLAKIDAARHLAQDEGAYYFLLQVRSRTSRPGWVVLEPEGSFQAWINGREAADLHSPVREIPRRVILPLRLAAGWNRILVKTTDAEEHTLALRLVDGSGRELTGLEEEKDLTLHPLPEDPGDGTEEAPFPGILHILENEKGPWAGLLRCHHLMHLGLSSAGLAQARAFRGENEPEQPRPWLALYASRLLRAWHLPSDLRRNKARPILEALAGGKDAAALQAGLELVELLLDDDQGEKALEKLRAMKGRHPGLYALLAKELQAYERLGWQGEKRSLRLRLARLAPRRSEYLSAAARRSHRLGDTERGYELLQQAHALDRADTVILSRLRRRALDLGRLDDASRWLELERRLTPHDPTHLARSAELEDYRGNREKAFELLEKLSLIQPERSEWLWRQAQLLPRERAIPLYRKVLALEPSRHRIRRLLAVLEGRKWGAELAAFRANIPEVIANFKMKERYRQSSSTLVVDHMTTRVFADGSWHSEIHQLRRINDLQGVDDYGEVHPQGEPVILRAWLPDGRISEPIEVGGSYEIPDLAPGCFIEELSRLSYRQPLRGAREVTDFWFSRFDEDFLWTRLIVMLPEDHRGEFRLSGRLDPPRVEKKEGLLVYTFDHRDMPRVKREPFMPRDEELLPWTLYGEDRPAAEINRELRERFLRRIKGSMEIREALEEICRGPMGDGARIEAIHRFVQDRVPDRQGSSDPTAVLLKREGERWFLEAAMLRTAGIPMRFAYIHPHSPGTDEEYPPLFQTISTWSSWYSLPALKLYPRDAPSLWLIAGMPRYLPLGMIHEGLGGAPVLMLDQGGPTLDFLPPAEPIHLAQFICTGTIRLLAGSEAEGNFTLTLPGAAGFSLKAALARFTRDQRQRFVSGRIVAPLFRGAALQSLEIKGLEEKKAPLRIAMKLRYRHFLQSEGGRPAVPTGIDQAQLGRLATGPERTWPFVFTEQQTIRWKVTIDPGEHWRIEEHPPSMMRRFEFITWDLRFRTEGGKIQVAKNLILRPGRIGPEKYKRLITVCRKIDEAENRKIILLPRK